MLSIIEYPETIISYILTSVYLWQESKSGSSSSIQIETISLHNFI